MIVKDLNGKELCLPSLWEKNRVVCGFLRHVGCRFCWKLANTLNTIYQNLKDNNVSLIAVINAT